MTTSISEFLRRTGAELVAGNLIHGTQGNRKIVGFVSDGQVVLNEDGDALLAPPVKAEVDVDDAVDVEIVVPKRGVMRRKQVLVDPPAEETDE